MYYIVIMLFLGFKAIRRIARLALIVATGFAALSLTGCPTGRGIGTVAKPTATPETGSVISGDIQVTLQTETPGADIFYTTNGKTPTKNDLDTHKYSNNDSIPITPPETVITAIAVKYGMYNSEILTAKYTVEPILLTENQWATGNLSTSSSVQWFKFTATVSSTQYIFVAPRADVYVQMYDSNGVAIGSETYMYDSSYNTYISKTVTIGQVYYIKVWPYSYYSYYPRTYKIGFNRSLMAPTSP